MRDQRVLQGFPPVTVRSGVSKDVDFPSGVRYRSSPPCPPAAAARRNRPAPDPPSIGPNNEVVMDNEQPDWNFWCFITSLLDLYIQLATYQ